MFLQNSAPLNAVFMAIFTLASGATLSIYFVANADVAQKALAITGAATLLTALIATYSDIDFTWLGNILFISLLVLIIVSIIGLFVKIKGAMQKFIAFCGVFIFTGYLLYDFSRLAKLKGVDAANNWNTALNFAVSIYLDIINLFIQLMNLLGNSN
jgi:FtsH-binding integral membrane protein